MRNLELFQCLELKLIINNIKPKNMKTEIKKTVQVKTNTNSWSLFAEFMPELNQKIEIYWSTDEITKQFWKNDTEFIGNAIPRLWRACH